MVTWNYGFRKLRACNMSLCDWLLCVPCYALRSIPLRTIFIIALNFAAIHTNLVWWSLRDVVAHVQSRWLLQALFWETITVMIWEAAINHNDTWGQCHVYSYPYLFCFAILRSPYFVTWTWYFSTMQFWYIWLNMYVNHLDRSPDCLRPSLQQIAPISLTRFIFPFQTWHRLLIVAWVHLQMIPQVEYINS